MCSIDIFELLDDRFLGDPRKVVCSTEFLHIFTMSSNMSFSKPQNFSHRTGSSRRALRERFLQKDYGIGGDGGFYFNRKLDKEHIKGFNPRRGRKGNTLTDEDIAWNRKFSQMRVIVENAIGRLKKWRVLKGLYSHLKGERSQLYQNNIVAICCAPTNRFLT